MKHESRILSILSVVAALTIAFALSALSAGCQATTGGVQPDQQISAATAARETLWAAIQEDKDLFTTEEWARAEAAHSAAIDLSAELIVGVGQGAFPSASTVEGWVAIGMIIYTDAEMLITPKLPELSTRTRTAWAMEKARLRELKRTAAAFIANPDAQNYVELARIAMQIGGLVLGTAL